MSDGPLYLGVDGGGTKTEFVCIDGSGAIVARALTGTTYHLQVGLEGAVAALREGVAAICAELGMPPQGLANVFFGLPAYGEDGIVDPQLAQACERILGHRRFTCGNDMICGWAGSLACRDGINLVAGTGSIGYGERQGRAARVGGWGEIFSDEGSAYWIAVRGLNAFTRMSDGRLAPGPLHRRFADRFDLVTDLDLCAAVMGERGLGRDQIASLAPIVSAAAQEGDEAAAAILRQAALELASMAQALRRTLGFEGGETAELSWSGGVVAAEPIVRQELERMLTEAGDFALVAPRHAPGYGAALYAAHLKGEHPVAEVRTIPHQ
jgi:N-acetylglucosamine kinase-like BadF-type ATPase